MPLTIDLSAREVLMMKLAVLAMLGHPRWQSDPKGGREALLDVYEQTSAAGDEALALRVEPGTVELLDSALRRLTSELKNYDLLGAAGGGQRSASMVEGFDEELRQSFPEAAADQGGMDRLVPEIMELRRDFSQARRGLAEMAETAAGEKRRGTVPRWKFWKRQS